MGDRPAHTSTAGWRARSSCPTRSRRERLAATAPRARCARYAGLKEEYYLADFEPDEAVLARARRSTARARSSSCARRRRSRSTTASRTTCSRRCSTRCAAPPSGVQAVVLPACRQQRERARARRRVHRARARDRRPVADRARRSRDLRGRHDEPRGGRARHARSTPPSQGRLGAVDERLIAEGRLRRAARRPRRSTAARARPRPPRAARAPRPATLVELLLTPVAGAPARAALSAAVERATISAMRRRIRSAAFPLHRHSLPQLAVDGALVALAYYLAFRLRFDNGAHGALRRACATRRSGGSLLGSLPVLVLRPRLPAPLALRQPARLRGGRARAGRRSCC